MCANIYIVMMKRVVHIFTGVARSVKLDVCVCLFWFFYTVTLCSVRSVPVPSSFTCVVSGLCPDQTSAIVLKKKAFCSFCCQTGGRTRSHHYAFVWYIEPTTRANLISVIFARMSGLWAVRTALADRGVDVTVRVCQVIVVDVKLRTFSSVRPAPSQ